ncbi:MAG: helix-turn-helix domain-containing protein [Lachnospiraceae bacterium]|nr:helix-turn-helix domain-containing protein [Lachnospiraceae bacterium]
MTINVSIQNGRMTEKELSEHWGIKRNTLQKWRSLGTGPIYVKLGGKVVYPLEAIREYEKSRTFIAASERVFQDK